jgi:OOP family OmpA-OmpF porin
VYLFDNDQDWDDALAYGLSLGFNYTKNWGTEFTLNYARTEDDEKVLDDIDVGIFRWDVLYHFFPECTVVPYLAVGMGGLYADPENGGDDLDFMADWGGGLKYYVTENIALRADARHIFEVEDDFRNFLFSGGLMIQFGR